MRLIPSLEWKLINLYLDRWNLEHGRGNKLLEVCPACGRELDPKVEGQAEKKAEVR